MQAAAAQRTRIARLAAYVIELDRQLATVDKLIARRFRTHRQADIITSMVGIGNLLGAKFLAATGGNITAFSSPNYLAGCFAPATSAQSCASGATQPCG